MNDKSEIVQNNVRFLAQVSHIKVKKNVLAK